MSREGKLGRVVLQDEEGESSGQKVWGGVQKTQRLCQAACFFPELARARSAQM